MLLISQHGTQVELCADRKVSYRGNNLDLWFRCAVLCMIEFAQAIIHGLEVHLARIELGILEPVLDVVFAQLMVQVVFACAGFGMIVTFEFEKLTGFEDIVETL